ncbi:MAG TPA: DUF5615 family PIN-like protein [Polyangia bacterium]|jgi:predicted nuclease of predicted toxin-antitoxin system
MRFLVDADLPRRAADLLRRAGHDAVDVRDVGLGPAPDEHIAAYARENARCLVTGDFGFADIRNYPPGEYHGLVVLQLPPNATGPVILALLADLVEQAALLERLPGRLAIVEPGRVRLRPA